MAAPTAAPVRSEVRDGMHIDWDAPVPMSDGTVLRADVFRPVSGEPVPVLLSYGPYAKGLHLAEGYPAQWAVLQGHPDVFTGTSGKYLNWEVVDPEKWVPDGYAVVRVDSRGAGRSPGTLHCFSPQETDDLVEAIAWAAAQPWSTGKVGMSGVSYYAINQWHAAAAQAPGLAAICVWEGGTDQYRDASHHGGIFCTFSAAWFAAQVATIQHGYGERGATNPVTGMLACGPDTLSDAELAERRVDSGAEFRGHGLDDDFYAARRPAYERIRVPLLSAGNWGGAGLHLRGNVEGYLLAGTEAKWLEMHGLEHWTHFYTDYGVGLQKRFFGHFLHGADTGWDRQPPVQLQVRHVDGTFTERAEPQWPIARTRWTVLHLDPVRMRLGPEPVPGAGEVTYDTLGEGVTFLGDPVTEPTEITGGLALRLWISSSTSDADVFAVLRVLDPEGADVRFVGALDPRQAPAHGWLRASHRELDAERSTPQRPYHPHRRTQPLTPGEVVELAVEILPTCVVLPHGHRIALTVLGRDFAYPDGPGTWLGSYLQRGSGPFQHDDPDDRPAAVFDGRVTLHTGGARPSSLLVPVVPEP